MAGAQRLLRAGALAIAVSGPGCSDPLALGSDLVWTADTEPGSLEQWTENDSGGAVLPSADSVVEVSTERAHHGKRSVKLVNPAAWDNMDQGPQLFHAAGSLSDAYYSAWFYLPLDYRIEPSMTLIRLGSRDVGGTELFSGEELQLRSVASGGYVLQVFSNNAGFLLEPLADPAPHVDAGRWFQLEARYQPQSAGRLRVWLDGALAYDLPNRPGAHGAELVLSVCNVAELTTPAPAVVYVDDAAVSLSRVSPSGQLAED